MTRLKVPSFVPMWDEEQSEGDGKCQTRRCLSQPTSRWQKINWTKVSKPGDRRQWKRERKCWVLLFRKFWSDSLWWSAFPKVSKNWVMVECCCAGVAPVVSVQTPIRPALLSPPPISAIIYTKTTSASPCVHPQHMHLWLFTINNLTIIKKVVEMKLRFLNGKGVQ